MWIVLNGEIGCKIVQTLRVFGPYLSSMVLICISLDRYFAITKSVRICNNRFRFKTFLIAAWAISISFSIPQSIVTQLDHVDSCPAIYRCESITYFDSRWSSVSYRLMKLCVLYFMPLSVIVYCYYYICSHVVRHQNELRRYSVDGISTISTTVSSVRSSDQHSARSSTHSTATQSLTNNQRQLGRIQRTTRQTIKMTLIIILAFVVCWSPYTILDLINIFAPAYHVTIDPYVKDLVLLIAFGNSVINPLIYGSHINVFKTAYRRYRSSRA